MCRVRLRNNDSSCSYYGRCVEPLAWNLEQELVRYQNQCPLFTTIPKELRDLIFEFALTDGMEQSLESVIKRNASYISIRIDNQKPTNDIAVNLLRTCRSIYLDTWTLPLSLNSFISYRLETAARPGTKLSTLLPWQTALIQGLDMTLQQTSLESRRFQLYINRYWLPGDRHKGVYVSPINYKTSRGSRAIRASPQPLRGLETATDFSFLSAEFLPAKSDEPRHFLSHVLGETLEEGPATSEIPYHSAMRVMRAKPLTHLTLRLQHQYWWSWTDSPSSTDDTHHLGLDPAIGDGEAAPSSRPTASRMRAFAEARRKGFHPEPPAEIGWAHKIAAMPDLKTLELVLETYKSKRVQLEDVVEASKTWVFPLEETGCELVWDGEVGMRSWSINGMKKVYSEEAWHNREVDFEGRTVRFVRRRIA
jgi:hypothetical protein